MRETERKKNAKRLAPIVRIVRIVASPTPAPYPYSTERLRVTEKLEVGKEDAYFAQKLARIVTDAPCELDLEKARLSGFNFRGLEAFLETMEIHSLKGRLKKIAPDHAMNSKDQMSLF